MDSVKEFISLVCIAFLLGLAVGFAFAASDSRAAEVVADYKSGKIVCLDVGKELVCRSAK